MSTPWKPARERAANVAHPAARSDPARSQNSYTARMGITHIVAPAATPTASFVACPVPTAVAAHPVPRIAAVEAFESSAGDVSTGTWEATPGVFRRAIMDAEFSCFLAGRATFETDDGQRFEFRAGDSAYFPPFSRGVWTIHETLRKTYCVWKK